MAQFTADIAGLLAIFAVAGGLVLFHRASKESPAKFLKAAAWVLVVGGAASGVCTTYYWFSYQGQGHFDAAHHAPAMHGPMGAGSMMHGQPGMPSHPHMGGQ